MEVGKMKKLSIVAVSVIFSAVLQFSACGSSGGSSGDCDAVCAKVGECGEPGDQQECLGDCPDMAKIIRSSCWSSAVSCIKETSCGANFDANVCLVQAGQSQPDSVIEPLATTLCTKANECDSSTDIEECKTSMLSDPDTALFKIFVDSVLSCIGSCVDGKTCDDIGTDIESVTAECACGCGISMLCN